MKVEALSHIVLKVRSLETSIPFYRDVLGLKLVARYRGAMAFFSAGSNHHDIALLEVGADKSVSGSVTTTGVAATAAHIHIGAAGKIGPVIIPLTKTSDNVWSVSAGAKLTDAQYESYKAGGLYVNVHSAANKGGEVRGQLKP